MFSTQEAGCSQRRLQQSVVMWVWCHALELVGKKALAKAQAGSYDEKATRAKIESLIADNKVWWLRLA